MILMFKKASLLLLSLSLFSQMSFAATLSGKVVDSKSVGLDGVLIQLKNKGLSTTTANGGLYSFSISANSPSISPSASLFQISSQSGLVTLNLMQTSYVSITIYDMLNRSEKVFEQSMVGSKSFDLLSMSRTMYSKGVYFARVAIGDQVYSLRLLRMQDVGQSSVDRISGENLSRLSAVPVDSIIASKSGYLTVAVPVASYSATLANITLTANAVNCVSWAENLYSFNGSKYVGPACVTENTVKYSCVVGSEPFCNAYSPSNNAWNQWEILGGSSSIALSSSSVTALSSVASSSSSVKVSSVVASSSSIKVSSVVASSSVLGSSSVSSSSSSGPNPCAGTTPGLKNWFTSACFDALFPKKNTAKCVADGNAIYSYSNFMKAAEQWPNFGSEGDIIKQKKDVAAFLAHVNQETGGGNPDSAFSLCWVYERAAMPSKTLATYNKASWSGSPFQPVPGQYYFGRGPFQLSWPANYGWFSNDVLGDMSILLNNPDKVATDGVIAFKTALWFWNQKQDDWLSPLPPTLHDVIVKGTSYQSWAGFGATTKVINGALECSTNNVKMMTRGRYYGSYQKLLAIPDANQDKTNLFCNGSSSY
jgi:hypothetical protein